MDMNIANRLYAYRKQHHFSQEELAEQLGVSLQTVSAWEDATASPDAENLLSLAALYGVTVDQLLHENSAPAEAAEETEEAEKKDTVSFKNGIHVHSKEGDTVDIGLTGVHVHSPKDGTRVDVGCGGVQIEENGETKSYTAEDAKKYFCEKPDSVKSSFEKFPYPIVCVIAYIVFGFLNICGGWAFGWLVFLTIPLYYSLISAVSKRNPAHFAYPVLVTMVYIYLGAWYCLWHPMWILYLTIPVYYWLANLIKKND